LKQPKLHHRHQNVALREENLAGSRPAPDFMDLTPAAALRGRVKPLIVSFGASSPGGEGVVNDG
jgi:hypothetical protein